MPQVNEFSWSSFFFIFTLILLVFSSFIHSLMLFMFASSIKLDDFMNYNFTL